MTQIASSRQQAIYDAWQQTDNNILCSAVAGSGKTTTLMGLLELCDDKTLFLAFNKSIQEEIEKKITDKKLIQGKAMTLHALGLKAIRENYNSNLEIEANKNYQLIRDLQKKYPLKFKYIKWEDKVRLTYTLMDMNDISRLFLTNDFKEISENFATMGKIFVPHPKLEDLWNKLIAFRDEVYLKPRLVIDFIDMIYIPCVHQLKIPIDPVYLMVDEAQDLNYCQHILIDNLIKQGDVKKWIAVGDRNQSIYAFSGAYTNSFDRFLEKDNVKEFPLDKCYRCSTAIIDSANEVYNVMKPSKVEEGIVDTIDSPSQIKEDSLIICRNSKPLIDLYFTLLGYGKKCHIKGDDILNLIVRFMKPYGYDTVAEARDKMFVKFTEMKRVNTEEGRRNAYFFEENFINFKKLARELVTPDETVSNLLALVRGIFSSKDSKIGLCTIHKAKGLESDIIYILNESLIPSRFATNPEQLKQEENLKYVARTRAKKEMYFLEI